MSKDDNGSVEPTDDPLTAHLVAMYDDPEIRQVTARLAELVIHSTAKAAAVSEEFTEEMRWVAATHITDLVTADYALDVMAISVLQPTKIPKLNKHGVIARGVRSFKEESINELLRADGQLAAIFGNSASREDLINIVLDVLATSRYLRLGWTKHYKHIIHVKEGSPFTMISDITWSHPTLGELKLPGWTTKTILTLEEFQNALP